MPFLYSPSHESRLLRPFAASALCLYFLLNVFLILCLGHPHNTQYHDQAKNRLGSVCEWVHKTVSPHVPASGVSLPLAATVLVVCLLLPHRTPDPHPIRLTGRSPPLLAFA
jgi:hypothetical protein